MYKIVRASGGKLVSPYVLEENPFCVEYREGEWVEGHLGSGLFVFQKMPPKGVTDDPLEQVWECEIEPWPETPRWTDWTNPSPETWTAFWGDQNAQGLGKLPYGVTLAKRVRLTKRVG